MNQYQFDQITRRMERRYGKIKKGTEEDYTVLFFTIEGNMLSAHRNHPEANGRRAREAVMLALHFIEGRITGEEKELSAFENKENLLLLDAILYAIDPMSSEKGMEKFREADGDEDKLGDKSYLEQMFHLPALCLLRLIESIDLWTRKMGPDGYFNFMEGNIGSQVSDDMNVCFSLPKERKRQNDPDPL